MTSRIAICFSLRLLRRRRPPVSRTSSMSVLNVSAPRCGPRDRMSVVSDRLSSRHSKLYPADVGRGKHSFECVAEFAAEFTFGYGCLQLRTFEDIFGTELRIRPSRPRAGCDSSRRCEMSAAIVTTRLSTPARTAARSRRTAPATRLRLTRRGRVVFTALAALPLVVWALVAVLGSGGAAADAGCRRRARPPSSTSRSSQATRSGRSPSRSRPTATRATSSTRSCGSTALDDAVVEPGQRLALPGRSVTSRGAGSRPPARG